MLVFTFARWPLPGETITGRPLPRPIKGRVGPQTRGCTHARTDPRREDTQTDRRTGGGRTDEDLEVGAPPPSQDLVKTPLCNL
jgi:hypothetical protein